MSEEVYNNAKCVNTLITKLIGTRIREEREKRSISIKNFANEIGVGITTVSELEKGYNFPKLETVLYIAFSLGITMDELINIIKEVRNQYTHLSPDKLNDKMLFSDKLLADDTGDNNVINTELLKLDTFITANLNITGINMVKEYVNFISSQTKYQSRSAYSKKKDVTVKP